MGSLGQRPNRTHDKIQGTQESQALLEMCGQRNPEITGRDGSCSAGQQHTLQEVGERVPMLPEEEEDKEQEGGAGDT